jgi:metal-responsive CopG/Arc/MetJ family transcriptional regulator
MTERVTMSEMQKMEKTERLSVRVDPEFMEALDELRRKEKDLPTRGEFVRRFVMRAYQQSAA